MKPKIISIIGGRGKLGSLFVKAFKSKGYKILVSDKHTELSNIEAAKQGDVVIVCVPIRSTIQVIKEIGSHVKQDALLTDFTSVKVFPCKAMAHFSKAEVIGCHPLFGPSVGIKGQNAILCPVRGNKYIKWYKSTLESFDLSVDILTPEQHDKEMAIIQALNHLSNLSFGNTLKRLNPKIINGKHNTPAFLLRLATLGRLFAQDKELYSDLMVYNPYTKQVMSSFTNNVQILNKIVQNSDKKKLEEFFADTKSTFLPIIEDSAKATTEFVNLINRKKIWKNKK